MSDISCNNCHNEYPQTGVPFRCSLCGGIFDYSAPPHFKPEQIGGEQGLKRYQHTFGLPVDTRFVTLGEGNTPLLLDNYMGKEIAFKMENLNPTGSHKDRATAVLVSHLLARGVTSAVEDSSGNAGASFAAYAAASNIEARILVPESASGPKRKQIETYGASIENIPGPRSNASKAALEYAANGWTYASHAYLPFGINGLATIAYELVESLHNSPGSIIIPAGHGSLALGIIRGFAACHQAGIIKHIPYYVIVQPESCSPICDAANGTGQRNQEISKTIAEGTSVPDPVRGRSLVEEIRPENGMFLTIEEKNILSSYFELAKRGLYVEPTSALVWSALKKQIHDLPEPIVLILTGSGLKT